MGKAPSETWLADINSFAKRIIKEHPKDYNAYAAYHILVGGSPPASSSKLDFPEPFSVKDFLTSMLSPPEKNQASNEEAVPKEAPHRPTSGSKEALVGVALPLVL